MTELCRELSQAASNWKNTLTGDYGKEGEAKDKKQQIIVKYVKISKIVLENSKIQRNRQSFIYFF